MANDESAASMAGEEASADSAGHGADIIRQSALAKLAENAAMESARTVAEFVRAAATASHVAVVLSAVAAHTDAFALAACCAMPALMGDWQAIARCARGALMDVYGLGVWNAADASMDVSRRHAQAAHLDRACTAVSMACCDVFVQYARLVHMGGAKGIAQSALLAATGFSSQIVGIAAAAHTSECDASARIATPVRMASGSSLASSVPRARMGILQIRVRIVMVARMAACDGFAGSAMGVPMENSFVSVSSVPLRAR